MILLFTLLVMAAVLFLALVLLGIYQGMNRSARLLMDAQAADLAAQSGLREAASRLREDPDWTTGFDREPLAGGATFSVTFAPDSDWRSTNNARGSVAVTGTEGRTVPASYVHVVCVATCGWTTRRQEAFIKRYDAADGQQAIFIRERW